jgi:Acetyltransferase (GNAT) domain
MNGYAHASYAASLSEIGTPRVLPRSGGWVLERPIALTPYCDAMGCYPLFACQDWTQLHLDLDELRIDLVTLALVADPFGEHDPAYLRACFPDLVVPFKEHMVIDLSRTPGSFVDAHHRRNARKALERVNVELCADATVFADEWSNLYANLVERHGIRGIAAFSASSFRKQLTVPGLAMFRAVYGDETVGITLWYTDRGVAYYHLGAYTDAGYHTGASFALFWRVIEHFSAEGLHWINLGAGPGSSAEHQEDGLTRFKRGWATGTRTAFCCGRIFDHKRYAESVRAVGIAESEYFPAYRTGEFC